MSSALFNERIHYFLPGVLNVSVWIEVYQPVVRTSRVGSDEVHCWTGLVYLLGQEDPRLFKDRIHLRSSQIVDWTSRIQVA